VSAATAYKPLNFDEAMSGLDLVADRRMVRSDVDQVQPKVARLIERVLDQLAVRKREATDAEDVLLRRAIAALGDGEYEDAISNVYYAANVQAPTLSFVFMAPDRAMTLREALSDAAHCARPPHAS
jgi:hypothetical protein